MDSPLSIETTPEFMEIASICAAYERGIEESANSSAINPYKRESDEEKAWTLGRTAVHAAKNRASDQSYHQWLIKGRQKAEGLC